MLPTGPRTGIGIGRAPKFLVHYSACEIKHLKTKVMLRSIQHPLEIPNSFLIPADLGCRPALPQSFRTNSRANNFHLELLHGPTITKLYSDGAQSSERAQRKGQTDEL
jgi:hypothetical protein